MSFHTIEEAIDDIRQGKMVILVDDEDRENEGDLTIAAEKVTPEAINFMTRYGRGLICLSLTSERLAELQIPPMVEDIDNTSPFGTAFMVSIEARRGSPQAFQRLIVPRRSSRRSIPRPNLRIWCVLATFSPCEPGLGVYWSGLARQRALSIWPGWRD